MSAHVDPEPRYGRRPATFTDVSGDPDQRLIDAVIAELRPAIQREGRDRNAIVVLGPNDIVSLHELARRIIAMCAPPEGYVLLSPDEAETAASWAESVQSEWGVEALQGSPLTLARRLGLES